jgi:peptide deformylase
MAIDAKRLQILIYPDPALRTRATRVESITDEVRAVAERMLQLMHQAEGIGLAAPQVGVPWRMFVTGTRQGHPERIFIDPELADASADLELAEEGCLSIPNVRVNVRRPQAISITAKDLEGNEISLRADDLMARVWQHETDHLNGVLIIDRMSPMDRLANRKALRDLEAGASQ